MKDETIGLERLDQTALTLAEGEQDLRGRTVVSSDGEEIGTVERLYVDPDERKVRFLHVTSGGILGIGQEDRFVPIEAIDSLDGEQVRLGHDRGSYERAPAYDPELVEDPGYWEDVYSWYGYPPYWSTTFPMAGGYLPQVGYPPGTSGPSGDERAATDRRVDSTARRPAVR